MASEIAGNKAVFPEENVLGAQKKTNGAMSL
jgi:hypothetical protein